MSALGAYVIVVAAGGGNISQGADTSLIFLLIPMLILALIIIVVFGGLIYLTAAMLKALPPKFFILQGFFLRIQTAIQKASDKLAEPAIRTKSTGAVWGAIRRNLSLKKPTEKNHVEGP